MPVDLFQKLQTAAFFQNKSVSGLLSDGARHILKIKTVRPGEGIMGLMGAASKYGKVKKPYSFNRRKFYEEEFKHRGIL